MKPEAMQEAEDNNPVFEVVEAGCDQPVGMEGVVEIQETAAEVKQENESLKGEYTWTLENFSQITEPKKYSPNFEIGTHLWRLLVCPHGMNQKEMLSVYLDSPEAAFAPPNLNPTASFKLVVVNRKDPGNGDFWKESSHKWSANETDWGFTNFLPFVDLHDPDKGFLEGDALTLRVEIQVQRDERYCYDSRKETGHVGLKNQGATCYMNSLLQYLYHLPFFRKAVYHMPTSENDIPAKSLPLALQSLFYRLQYSTTPVATKDLTASFGWSTMDAFMQHDVQELNRVLCEKLEEKMKGTRVEKAINELFEGHTLNFIDCVSVDYKSQRRESFMDLQLDVKGCNHIYDSFDKYTEVEVMDGENQYKAEGYGLQDARKGVLFDSLPPVLQLQLKRFEYDFQRDTMVKINDRYEFFDELDLDRDNGKYLSPQADRSVRNLYRLHSVLVHSGGVHGGHYYAFIRPDGSTWLRFDDTAVTIEDSSKALEEQFGGEDEAAPAAGAVQGPLPEGAAAGVIAAAAAGEGAPKRLGGGGLKFTKFSNAYMLVYVRVSDWPRIMAPVTKDSIAPYLRERLEAEQREKERRQKEKQEAHLYCHVRIATDQDIADQVGRGQWFDLVDYDRLPPSRTFRVRKLTLFSDFKKQVEAALGVPADAQRYWVWQLRQNKTYRPTARLKADEEAAMIVDLREHRELSHATAKHALMDLRLYLELPWPPSSGPQKPPSRHDILLFFKYFDPLAETLAYVGHEYVPKTLKVSDLSGLMARLAGLPPGTPLDAYEEVKWEPTVMIELLNPAALLSTTAQLESGDIICFQKALPQQPQQQQQQPSLSAAASGMSVDGGTAAAEGMEVDQQQQQPGQRQLAQQQQQQSQQPSQQLQPQQQQQQQPHGELLQCRYPRVPEFLSYVRNRRLVTFKRLESPSEPGLQLELLREQDYDAVTAALAGQLGLDDPSKIRLTQHNAYSFQPQRAPIRYRGIHQLQAMLQHAGHVTDVLYYEVLDMPLPQLEQLKSLKIHFHNDKTEFVAEHVVRLPRDSTVGDVLRELSGRLGPEYAGRRLRLLEIYHNKIYKVADEAEEVMNVNENYWLIRAEAVPPDEEQLGPGDRIIHVHHITPPPAAPAAADAAAAAAAAPAVAAGGGEGDNNNVAGGGGFIAAGPPSHVPTSFGDPFMLRIGPDETLGQVKARIQAKLGVPAAEFASWRAAFVSIRSPPEYLADSERLAGRFAAAGAAVTEAPYLGLEHEDKGPRRPAASSSRYTFERPVKIYN